MSTDGSSNAAEQQTNPKAPFDGQRVGFVGKLGGMNRKEARKLVREHGGVMVDPVDQTVSLIVVGADQIPLDDFESLISPDVWQSVCEGNVVVCSETDVWEKLGLVEPEADSKRLYTPAMLAQLLGVSITTIRRWHRRGLITPVRNVKKLPYFDFQEVSSAQRIAKLISSGTAPEAIEKKLSALTNLFPGIERPLSQLSVILEGEDLLLRSGQGLVEPGGQRRFDFESGTSEPPPEDAENLLDIDQFRLERESMTDFTSPQQFFELAVECEDAEELDSATEVYRAMQLAFGPTSDSCFRLAELLYQQGDLSGARERYYMAVELDDTFVEARASLGCVLMELGDNKLAYAAFQGALEHHSDYPDVQFHLARLLDEMERSEEADVHWKNFLDLAPQSPWSDEARERLGIDSVTTD